MTIHELENRVKVLEDELSNVKATQEIEKLQKIYGYYLDAGYYDEIIDLFAENAESIEIGGMGVYLGKKGVVKLMKNYSSIPHGAGRLALHLQLQGVVNVDPDGKTAKGRWYCLMIHAPVIDGIRRACWGHAKYENEYVKENGKWMFNKIHFNPTFRTPYEDGWVKTPSINPMQGRPLPDTMKPDLPSTAFHPYPEDFTLPFHYKNPITGR